MNTKLDTHRILIFLAFAFGIAWATGLVIALTGGLVNSPRLVGRLSLGLILLSTSYMWAPALANILTRLVTREGWHNLWLRPRLRQGWPYWLAAWFLPGLLVIVGAVIYYLLFPQFYDPALTSIQKSFTARGLPLPPSLWTVVLSQTLIALLIAPILNAIATFGEEFGWRAYLLPKLIPTDGTARDVRRALVLMGVIWGVWHWPVIFMSYEYGFNYPGWPWLGPLLFILFTFCMGVILGWVTLRSGSVWPAVIGHGAINGIANLPLLFLKGTPNLTVGPAAIGIVAEIGFIIAAAVLFASKRAMQPPQERLSFPIPPQPRVWPFGRYGGNRCINDPKSTAEFGVKGKKAKLQA